MKEEAGKGGGGGEKEFKTHTLKGDSVLHIFKKPEERTLNIFNTMK